MDKWILQIQPIKEWREQLHKHLFFISLIKEKALLVYHIKLD